MNARTNPSPPIETVRGLVHKLAPLLIRAALNVTVDSRGVVEVRNPRDIRMKQPLVIREHEGDLWWCWVWSGPTRNALPEYEPMVLADDFDEAARRIVNVLRIEEPAGAER